MLDVNDIMKLLPHRFPFLLVDRIVEIEPGKKIVGLKNVTINEPFFPGHFPGHPVMPGVLIIEAMAQVAAIFVYHSSDDNNGKITYFVGIDNTRFRKPVVPGDHGLSPGDLYFFGQGLCRWQAGDRVRAESYFCG